MTTINERVLTLQDWSSRRADINSPVAIIIDMITKMNEIVEDIPFMEANQTTGHVSVMRSDLPKAFFRKLNMGIPISKSRTVRVTDTMAMLEALSTVDVDLVKLNNDGAAFRLSEAKAFLASMTNDFAEYVIYGDLVSTPHGIMGLSPRLSDPTAGSGRNLIDGGGTGDTNTSIWHIVFSDTTCHGIYPKGSTAGLQHTDWGKQFSKDENGDEFVVYKDHYKWDFGISVPNWKNGICRVCNIDVNNLNKNTSSGADLVDLMTIAYNKISNKNVGRAYFYCNETIMSFLMRQLQNRGNAFLNIQKDIMGKPPVLTFLGIPVRKCESILDTEEYIDFGP